MKNEIPLATIQTFAKTICAEARKYGFRQIDIVRLINEMLDNSASDDLPSPAPQGTAIWGGQEFSVGSFPLESERLRIRKANLSSDLPLLNEWLDDEYGRHFLLSCATAQKTDPESLLAGANNLVGIVLENGGREIGAVAFLDIDKDQKRAELRKLIGATDVRGKGYAEEATRLWIEYGSQALGLEKIYLSTLQTHIRNIQLNESIGFRVEGLLQGEVRIDNERFDVLRMGLNLVS